MNPIGVIDLISFLTTLVALIILWKGWKRAFQRDTKLLFAGLLVFILFYNFCLFLEWSGITKALDTLEDFIGALVPMLWAFVLYAFLQEMTVRDLHQGEERLRLEVTERKQAERAVEEAREYAESIVETVRGPLVVLDAGLRVISANRSFYQTFKVTPEETRGQLLYDIGNRQLDILRLRELLEQILPENTAFEDFEVEYDFPTIGRRVMLLNARRIYREVNKTQMILLAIEDITERKQAEEMLQESEKFFSGTLNDMLTFVAVLEPDGKVIFVNNTPLDVAGITLDDVKGKLFYDAFWWQYSEEARQQIKEDIESCASGETLAHDIELQRRNIGSRY